MSCANRKKSDWLVDIGSTENRKYGKMSVAQVGQGGEAAFDRGDALGSFTRPDRPRRELALCGRQVRLRYLTITFKTNFNFCVHLHVLNKLLYVKYEMLIQYRIVTTMLP